MNTSSPIPFNQTEDAFFLNCIGEVRKVWASKSGQANLNISVINGMVDLQLAFKLGLPGDPHHHPPQPFHKNPPKYKTPSQKAKDRARAAAHQQALLLRTSSESELPLKDDVNQQPQGTDPVPAKQEVALAHPHEPLLEADPAPPPPGLGQAAALQLQLSHPRQKLSQPLPQLLQLFPCKNMRMKLLYQQLILRTRHLMLLKSNKHP